MNSEEMKALILNYIIKEYISDGEAEITYDTPLISSGYVDSFSMISLLVFIERKFNTKIPQSRQRQRLFIMLIK
jgi:acyl carrier protein